MTTERAFLGVWIPKDIYLHKQLTPTEKLLLAEITSFSKNGICFASNEHFSEFLGISKGQVSRLITKLNRMGLVLVELIYKEGTKEVDKRLITPISIDAHTPTHECVDPLRIDAHTPTHSCVDPIGVDAYYKEHSKYSLKEQDKDIKINKKKKTSPKTVEFNEQLESEFVDFWELYPKKRGSRAKAKQAYIKARKIKKVQYETIIVGLKRYIEYLIHNETATEFIAHGSTWLNHERWVDEYILTGINKKPKNINEYMRQKYGENGGETVEPPRNRKIVNDYDEFIPDVFQGF